MSPQDLERCYVFLGPTLLQSEAERILPARYLPPARCGDVFKVVRLKPKAILIIDGLFEQAAAVWHKEILYALSQGIAVLGAASMGALRAVELQAEGMIGVGSIFTQLLNGELPNDDDEVAVAHAATPPFTSLSQAMVDIRATVARQVALGKLDATAAQELIDQQKRLFYPARQILQRFSSTDLVPQKALDAREALEFLRTFTPATARVSFSSCPATIYARTLLQRSNCEPFSCDRDWLPAPERLACRARLLGPLYRDLKTLAVLLSIAYRIKPNDSQPNGPGFARLPEFDNPPELNECIEAINRKLVTVELAEPVATRELNALLRLKGRSFQGVEGESFRNALERLGTTSEERRILEPSIILWCFIRLAFAAMKAGVAVPELRGYTDRFRRAHGLLTQRSLADWLDRNHLTKAEFASVMRTGWEFDYLVLRNNCDSISQSPAMENRFWLSYAIRLTRSDETVARLEAEPAFRAGCLQTIAVARRSNPDCLDELDFRSPDELELLVRQFEAGRPGAVSHTERSCSE